MRCGPSRCSGVFAARPAEYATTVDSEDPSISEVEFQRALEGSTWVFDISFLTEDSGNIEVTIKQEGESPITLDSFLDLKAGSSSTDTFPDELTLPDEAPQASGQDITGVQIAPVTTPAGIGQNDIQTFLVNNVGSQPASYSPGDWLEPKDGGNQRMMVVASSQAATAGLASQALHPKLRESAMPAAWGSFAEPRSYQSPASLPPRQQSMNPALTQISVVCMQLERDVPPRGARYFSQPKTAEGDMQTCQKNCVTEGGDAIQRCVWDCETNPSGDPYTPLESWTVSDGRVQFFFFSAGQCVNLGNTTLNGVTYTIHSSKWQNAGRCKQRLDGHLKARSIREASVPTRPPSPANTEEWRRSASTGREESMPPRTS